MTMTDNQTMNPTAPGNRLVTVDDLRYELQRERAITEARFGQVDARFEQIDTRFDRLEARFEARFDFLEQRLRFNKTLIVASLSAVASVASVVVSLLK